MHHPQTITTHSKHFSSDLRGYENLKKEDPKNKLLSAFSKPIRIRNLIRSENIIESN